MRRAVLVFVVLVAVVGSAQPRYRDVRDYSGYQWQQWTYDQRLRYVMGFQAGSFKVIEVLAQEGLIDPDNVVVDSLLLDYVNSLQIMHAVDRWYSDQASLVDPLWWVIFSTKWLGWLGPQ